MKITQRKARWLSFLGLKNIAFLVTLQFVMSQQVFCLLTAGENSCLMCLMQFSEKYNIPQSIK